LGLVLDSSVLIVAERRGHTVPQILEQLRNAFGEIDTAVSVVSIAELEHGAYRAQNPERQARRLNFIRHLINGLSIHPVTSEIARLAGRIDGQQQSAGIQIGFEDLLIGATALQLRFDVATLNDRDFRRIPGLSIVSMYR
jgi:predicted nucleic acid-binding protein